MARALNVTSRKAGSRQSNTMSEQPHARIPASANVRTVALAACRIADIHGIPLDWLYRGKRDTLPASILDKLDCSSPLSPRCLPLPPHPRGRRRSALTERQAAAAGARAGVTPARRALVSGARQRRLGPGGLRYAECRIMPN